MRGIMPLEKRRSVCTPIRTPFYWIRPSALTVSLAALFAFAFLMPDRPFIWAGQALEMAGMQERAISMYTAAIARNPAGSAAYYRRGELASRLGKKGSA